MYRVVILGSGRGSNAEAILSAQDAGQLGMAQVIGIISDQPDAGILKLGPKFDVPSLYLDPGKYRTKLSGEAEQHYIETIQSLSPQLVVMAGFMRVIKSNFLKAFEERIINLHPSLLPAFPGLNAIPKAFEAGVSETGCTVHWVNEEIDGGRIIDQEAVSIEKTDTLASLEEKVHAAEHKLLPAVINRLASDSFMNRWR